MEIQNVGKHLISDDLRLTEDFFTPQSGRTYLSVVASPPRPLPRIIWNTATLIDRHVVYSVLMISRKNLTTDDLRLSEAPKWFYVTFCSNRFSRHVQKIIGKTNPSSLATCHSGPSFLFETVKIQRPLHTIIPTTATSIGRHWLTTIDSTFQKSKAL